MNLMFRRRGWSFGFRSTIMLYFVVLIVLPIIGIYTQSFSLGWRHFWESVTDPLAWKSVLLTVKLAIISNGDQHAARHDDRLGADSLPVPGAKVAQQSSGFAFALPTAVGGLMILLLLGPNSFVGGLGRETRYRNRIP